MGLIATMVLAGLAGWYLVAFLVIYPRIVIENADVLFTSPKGSTLLRHGQSAHC